MTTTTMMSKRMAKTTIMTLHSSTFTSFYFLIIVILLLGSSSSSIWSSTITVAHAFTTTMTPMIIPTTVRYSSRCCNVRLNSAIGAPKSRNSALINLKSSSNENENATITTITTTNNNNNTIAIQEDTIKNFQQNDELRQNQDGGNHEEKIKQETIDIGANDDSSNTPNVYSLGLKSVSSSTSSSPSSSSSSAVQHTLHTKHKKSLSSSSSLPKRRKKISSFFHFNNSEKKRRFEKEGNQYLQPTKALIQEQLDSESASDISSSSNTKSSTIRNGNRHRRGRRGIKSIELKNDVVQRPLLDITMPSPSDYDQKKYQIKNNNNNSTTATSQTSINNDQQQQITNLTQSFNDNDHNNSTKPTTYIDVRNKKDEIKRDDISSFASSIMDTFMSQQQRQRPQQNELYSLATSLMPNPPKMKRTTQKQSNNSSSSTRSTSSNINPNTPLTMNDLQSILNEYGYIRRDELSNITSVITTPTTMSNQKNQNKTKYASSALSSGSASLQKKNGSGSVSSSSSGLAFPQPSILSLNHIRFGTSISSSIFAMLICISLQPNLWLLGGIIGAIVGNDIAVKDEQLMTRIGDDDDGTSLYTTPGGLYGDVSLKLGKKIALVCLQIWDVIQGIWFMYRTGQLSYEYYKTYASLDQKFKIQDKMDAWNSRFVEGKRNFDQWERENEIGRKVLAGIRTVWMLEENSYKSQKYRLDRKRSKYRVIQYALDGALWLKKFFIAVWNFVTGGGNNDLVEIINGVKIQVAELNLEIVSQRMGAALAALLAVNVVGAMFAIAPSILGVLSVIAGMIWPNWVSAAYQRIKDLIKETRARGRGEGKKQTSTIVETKVPLIDRRNFHFFVNEKGKKQWYRTGNSAFARFDNEKAKSLNLDFFKNGNNEKKKEENKGWWMS